MNDEASWRCRLGRGRRRSRSWSSRRRPSCAAGVPRPCSSSSSNVPRPVLSPPVLFPRPLPSGRQVVPCLRKHPDAPLAPDADADDVNLAADLDLDPAVLLAAVGTPLLLGAGVAKEPSHDRPPMNEKCMGRRLAGTGSSSEAPLKERRPHVPKGGSWMEPAPRELDFRFRDSCFAFWTILAAYS